jgi:hypothetical protein
MKGQTYILMRNYRFHDIKKIDYKKLDGFHFRPVNNISYAGVTVKRMVMINPTFVEKVLKRKIKKKLETYLRFIISIIDADDSDTDITGLRAALNDLTRYKETVRYKYRQYLDEKYATLLLQKIELLEQELKNKITYHKEPEEKEITESRRR